MILRSSLTRFLHVCRARYSTLPSHAVIFANDNMVVCWHPEPKFPYECSLPLPEKAKDPLANSVLCIGDKDVTEAFKRMKPEMAVSELAKLTCTTKHIWYPRSRDKKAKTTVPDRPYL